MKTDIEITEAQKKFGAKVRQLRERKGITQENMDADDWAVPVRTVQAIESGRTDVKFSTIYKLAKKLGVTPDKLLAGL